MKYTANRTAVEKLPVDFLGYIFYPSSKRFVGDNAEPGLFSSVKPKVAVFVDEAISEILRLSKKYDIHYVQLHGDESPEICKALKEQGITIIKAFNIDEDFNFSTLRAYENISDYFLFDTKTALPGGSGKKFNWEILSRYSGKTPFFLSGGVQPEDALIIRQITHSQLFGVDLNSGFEDEPGQKNIEKLKKFIRELKAV